MTLIDHPHQGVPTRALHPGATWPLCPASWQEVDPSNTPVNCPHCRRHVSVEPDAFGKPSIYPHTEKPKPPVTVPAVDRALDVLGRKVRQITNGFGAISTEPDVVDLAHAAELLDALTADPDLLRDLWRSVRPPAPSHLAECRDIDTGKVDLCAPGCPVAEQF